MQTCSVRNSDVCLIQITDCHLLADPDARLGGWNNWAALQAIFEDIRGAHPQPSGLLLTGDLAHDESPEAYQRLDALVMEWRVPVFALPGNHDDPEAMRLHMPKVQVTGSAQIGAWQLQLLDSHVDGQDSGQLGCNQLTHIEAELAQNQQPTLIAVHHPPAPVGSAWIDALGLHDGAELLSVSVNISMCGPS